MKKMLAACALVAGVLGATGAPAHASTVSCVVVYGPGSATYTICP